MTNTELQNQIEKLLQGDNYIDIIENFIKFEKEYKNTDFYKTTKISIIDLVKYYKILSFMDFNRIFVKIQEGIRSLDISHLEKVIDQFGDIFKQENNDILNEVNTLKDILN